MPFGVDLASGYVPDNITFRGEQITAPAKQVVEKVEETQQTDDPFQILTDNPWLFDQYNTEMANQNAMAVAKYTHDFNERMMKAQQQFNAEEAQKSRDWEESLYKTRYQTAVNDLEKAGLNKILAYTGVNSGVPSAQSASSGALSGANVQTYKANSAQYADSEKERTFIAGQNDLNRKYQLIGTAINAITGLVGGITTAGMYTNTNRAIAQMYNGW